MNSPRFSDCRGFALWGYALLIAAVAVATFAVLMLYQNIVTRKAEATQHVFKVVEVDDSTIDPAQWGKNYPRQYDSYKRTVDMERTKHGGSDTMDKLEADPRLRALFAGYAFSVDYRKYRGHAFMLDDQDQTERVKQFKQPGSCLHCHASVIPAYIAQGLKAGAPADAEHREEQIQKGFEAVCAMPYADARKLVSHPVSCVDCHEAATMNLRVSRPAFINGIRELANSDAPTPQLPSIERWRKDGKHPSYDPNLMATRQEMRSLVCSQCHVEYYFKGSHKLLTYPWSKGLQADRIEAYYDGAKFSDWKHKISGASVLKAQHPEFETWSQGIHARSGVACADCHMPYVREGAIKVSSHHVRSPLLNISQACQTCHRYPEAEIKARVEAIQDRHQALLIRAEDAVVGLIADIQAAAAAGASDEQLASARNFHRKAQWRLDFVAAENSTGFHAPQESARNLGEAIDYARQGEIAVLKVKKP
ncbi:MAG: ammonia-forming cytochrome c nitrite reductase subunit c552 [Opitutaceae bacterium]|jgi:nitrite reductase (cytochrome c-552)